MPSTIVTPDMFNQFPWSTKIEIFSDFGVLLARQTHFDDGSQQLEEFVDGVRSITILQDSGTMPMLNPWSQQEYRYDTSGMLQSHFIAFDDGTTRLTAYQNGVRTALIRMDGGDGIGAEYWDRIEYGFDAAGQVTSKLITYDTGLSTQITYLDGIRATMRQEDSAENLQSWTTIDTTYDAEGRIATRFTAYDNGTDRQHRYEDGRLAAMTQTDRDDVHNWARIETAFNTNGQRDTRLTVYDTGMERVETFAAGKKVTEQRTDAQDINDSWDQLTRYFNDDGQTILLEIVYDNGIRRQDLFSYTDPTMARIRVDIDEADQFDWAMEGVIYDTDDQKVAETTLFDNGDEEVLVFGDAGLALRADIDGDGSNAWFARLIEYDATGEVLAMTLYDEDDLLPPDTFGTYSFIAV